jgi:hypothetical protein
MGGRNTKAFRSTTSASLSINDFGGIKDIEEDTGCDCVIAKSKARDNHTEVGVYGMKENIEQAKQAILKLC